MQSVFANVRNFSGVIQFCEDEQDWRFRFAADLWSKELRQTGSLKIGILAKDMTDAEAESTSLFQKICILSRMLKVLFETARNREVVFTEYSSTTKVALRDISTECVRIDNIAKEIQENFLRMKKQHQSVRLETTKLSHALREASKYWKAYQTNFLEVSQGLRLERAVRKEAAQNLNTCQSDLKATRDENTVLLEDLAGRRAMAAKLAASLSEIEEREAKGRKDLSECRKNLENHQTEREKLSKAKMCEIESLQKVLAEEKAASQQAIQKCEKWEVEFQNSVGEYEELLNSAKADKRIIQNELEAEKAKTEQFEKLKSELEKEKEIAAQDRKTYELEYARVVRMMKAEHSLKHDHPECSDEIQKEMTGIDDMQTGNQLRAKERVSLLEKRSATVKSGSEGVSNSRHLQENLKGEPVTNILQKGPSRNVVRDQVIDPRDTARAPDVPELRPSVRKRRGSKATPRPPIRKKSRTVVGDVASRGRKQSSRNAKKARKERCRNSDESEDNHSDDDDWFLPYE